MLKIAWQCSLWGKPFAVHTKGKHHKNLCNTCHPIFYILIVKDTDGESIYFNCEMGNEYTGPRFFCSMLSNSMIYCIYAMKLVTHGVKTKIKAKIRNKSKVKKEITWLVQRPSICASIFELVTQRQAEPFFTVRSHLSMQWYQFNK